jgi:glyoxylase-like metal-dependent hydrolase (beta-lactamase superfamily II)
MWSPRPARAWIAVSTALTLLGTWPDARAGAAEDKRFDLQKVADGVYAALARPANPINCNAMVIVDEEGVLVVDTHSRPSSARSLIAEIRQVTDRPVRYVVNTHFHWDHAQGNAAYPSAFPKEVTLVSSEATRDNLAKLGMSRLKDQVAQAPKDIAARKARLAETKDAAGKAALEQEIRDLEANLAEISTLGVTLPDLTFDRSLVLHRKNRDILLLFLGRGHTNGDVVVYLPKERVVATGDLLHGWLPYMGDSYPTEWVTTLDAVARLDFEKIVGGHGGVQSKAHLKAFRDYLADLVAEVKAARQRGETLAQAKVSVAAALKPKHASLSEGRFDGSVGANIEKVFQDLQAGLY